MMCINNSLWAQVNIFMECHETHEAHLCMVKLIRNTKIKNHILILGSRCHNGSNLVCSECVQVCFSGNGNGREESAVME